MFLGSPHLAMASLKVSTLKLSSGVLERCHASTLRASPSILVTRYKALRNIAAPNMVRARDWQLSQPVWVHAMLRVLLARIGPIVDHDTHLRAEHMSPIFEQASGNPAAAKDRKSGKHLSDLFHSLRVSVFIQISVWSNEALLIFSSSVPLSQFICVTDRPLMPLVERIDPQPFQT